MLLGALILWSDVLRFVLLKTILATGQELEGQDLARAGEEGMWGDKVGDCCRDVRNGC